MFIKFCLFQSLRMGELLIITAPGWYRPLPFALVASALNGECSDVTIRCKGQKTVGGHKILLATAIPHLRTYLNSHNDMYVVQEDVVVKALLSLLFSGKMSLILATPDLVHNMLWCFRGGV